eukprot:COSAG05_NODE_12668_length_459_cov_0.855556_1_plen_71_part_00
MPTFGMYVLCTYIFGIYVVWLPHFRDIRGMAGFRPTVLGLGTYRKYPVSDPMWSIAVQVGGPAHFQPFLA